MKPTKLTLTNFGPFLNETIDFHKIDQNQLFLISGKTGSGKTMIFDAIVYALYGEASTKNRKESDLRSHFADGNSAMQVTFEFELNNKIFKIVRTGPYIKEGNTTKTPAKLNVFEYNDNEFDLRESMVSAGNQFIIDLIGVNAEQFRQLFILPQGEFKKFLLSNSKEKQGILRTLFNSERFEQIEKALSEDVKNEKKQIEDRYKNIERLWNDINTFDSESLEELKTINVQQTEKLINALPKFNEFGKKLAQSKYENKNILENKISKIEHNLNENKELESNLKELEKNKNQFNQLKEQEESINKQKEKLNKINEIKPLSQLLDRKNETNKKLKQIENSVESSKQSIKQLNQEHEDYQNQLKKLTKSEASINKEKVFLEKTYTFFVNLSKYDSSYKDKEKLSSKLEKLKEKKEQVEKEFYQLKDSIDSKDVDYEVVEQLSQDIFKLEKNIQTTEKQLEEVKNKENLNSRISEIKVSNEKTDKEIEKLTKEIADINQNEINLNNKETLVEQLQQVVSIGDTCPVCGNEITSLDQHIDFESINEKQRLLKSLQEELNEHKINKAKFENSINHLTEQLKNINVDEKSILNIDELNTKHREKEKEKVRHQKENDRILSINKKIEQKKQEIYEIENDMKDTNAKIEQCEIRINDFETTSQFTNIKEFKLYYEQLKNNVTEYEQLTEKYKHAMSDISQKLSIEENNVKHHTTSLNESQDELKRTQKEIENEMNRLSLSSIEQIQSIIEIVNEKESIEKEINDFNKQLHMYEVEINRLTKLVSDRNLEDIDKIQENLSKTKEQLNQLNNEIATLEYQIKLNEQKGNEVESNINYLNKELKEQQDIFNLSEILSGKNSQKLTLENYVLVYYLEKIIAQANIRLATMSGQRYQLQRRAALSQGFSGLEIDVFDFYSNKSRHISSLSGGETFQASLALALGLSEIVQQESGGISLQSIFIDEGFGTLDQETLETALDTLVNLKSTGRMVGIISHVSELKQRIPLILEVTSNQYQSTTQFKWN